jgi:3-phenylpropionate/trans-cinnamate dioxygenase ferredoxin subunit
VDEFVKVAATEDIPVGTFKAVEVDFERILIVHTDDGFFALADECTHDSGIISDGLLVGNEVVCPRHGARFDVKTGAVTAPPAIVAVDSYEVKVEDNNILVRVDR